MKALTNMFDGWAHTLASRKNSYASVCPIGFLIFTLESELQRVESELKLKLFRDGSHYPMFDRSAIRALDVVNDALSAQTEIQTGVLTINERRKAKHRQAIEGGDEPMVNGTMITLARAIKGPPVATPKAAP